MDKNLDMFREVIQRPEVLIYKKDLKKVAKEYGITKENLINKLNKKGYVYDKRAKGYICIEDKTEVLKIENREPSVDIERLCKMNMMLLEKLNDSNNKEIEQKEEKLDVIEADVKIVVDYDKEDFKATTIRVHQKIWSDFQRNHRVNHKNLTQQELHMRVLEEFNSKYNY